MGSPRILGTNLGNGLRLVGHDVRFGTRDRRCVNQLLNASDVVVHSARVMMQMMQSVKRRRSTRLRRGDAGRVVVYGKTNNVDSDTLNEADIAIGDSWLHAHSSHTRHGASDARLLVLPLLEVPTRYWRRVFAGGGHAPTRPAGAAMYALVPAHRPRVLDDDEKNDAALLCYHGNREHIYDARELWRALCALPSTHHAVRAPIRVLAIVGNSSSVDGSTATAPAAPCAGVVVEERWYRGVDDTFAQLSRCDVGLVPNLELVALPEHAGAPETARAMPTVALRYKTSANGGRAMVMAQVGLPFVGSPELETAQLLGAAGVAADRVFAVTADEWRHRLHAWLGDTGARAHAAAALRAYAERELLPTRVAALLDARIQAARRSRRARLRAAGLWALRRDGGVSASVQERVDVCYTLEGRESVERLERSMRSIARTAAEPHRLRFHLFVENATTLNATLRQLRSEVPHALHGLRVHSESAFANVTAYRAAALPKLRTRANYMRFYLPTALRHVTGIVKALYLDVDTVALHDVAPLYDRALATSAHAVAAGVQRADTCTLRKVFNFSEARVIGAKPPALTMAAWQARPCITASVIVMHLKRWRDRQLTRRVEAWLRVNAEAAVHGSGRLWRLGSMPPLILALQEEWERLLPAHVVDMKRRACCPKSEGATWARAVLLHPVKRIDSPGAYASVLEPVLNLTSHEVGREWERF